VGTDGEKMKDELYKVKDYAGISGSISIDQNGDLVGGTYKVYTVTDKKSQEVK
jgi:ABC-type branched-subunit amino acid transport system substrate-binding protein